jgi:hypothetical protein
LQNLSCKRFPVSIEASEQFSHGFVNGGLKESPFRAVLIKKQLKKRFCAERANQTKLIRVSYYDNIII